MITYEKIDENTVKKIETFESEIYLDKLEKQVSDLVEQIENIPEPKTNPDDETLDFWNSMNVGISKDELNKTLKDKEKLFKELKGL